MNSAILSLGAMTPDGQLTELVREVKRNGQEKVLTTREDESLVEIEHECIAVEVEARMRALVRRGTQERSLLKRRQHRRKRLERASTHPLIDMRGEARASTRLRRGRGIARVCNEARDLSHEPHSSIQ